MDLLEYQLFFQSVIDLNYTEAPYDDPKYLHYVRLNKARQQRWLKLGQLNESLSGFIKSIKKSQDWIFITEPWCGDAAHILPFVFKLSALNPLIRLTIERRDCEPFLINHYLTGTSKSIPKLIVRDSDGNDLFVWGPRPKYCQQLYNELKGTDAEYEQIKVELQLWYNEDRGVSFQTEILDHFKNLAHRLV